jgi:hypothetical protein
MARNQIRKNGKKKDTPNAYLMSHLYIFTVLAYLSVLTGRTLPARNTRTLC